jgi:hypothetical protein
MLHCVGIPYVYYTWDNIDGSARIPFKNKRFSSNASKEIIFFTAV